MSSVSEEETYGLPMGLGLSARQGKKVRKCLTDYHTAGLGIFTGFVNNNNNNKKKL